MYVNVVLCRNGSRFPLCLRISRTTEEDIKEVISVATKASEFKICQPIFVHDIDKSIERALDSLSRGAESIRFTVENETIDVVKLLAKLPLENTPIFFHFSFISIGG